MIKNFILEDFTYKLIGKKLIQTKRFRLYCDSGCPKFKWFPKYIDTCTAEYWGFKTYEIILFGREFFFSFGEDKKGFYK